MKKLLIILLLLITSSIFAGCASHNSLRSSIEQTAEQNTLGEAKNVQIFDKPYLGSTVRELDTRSAEFDKKATLSQRGTISEIAKVLESMFDLSFQVQDADNKSHRVYYEGTLKGLLDSITSSTGYGWQYHNKTITFAKSMSKTYTIYAMPGTNSYENNITNKSKDSSTTSSGIGTTVQSANTSADTAQTTQTEFEVNAFEEVVENVKALLSTTGTASANQQSGTITVFDQAKHIRLVDEYIDEVNEKMARQVAINVQVWSLEITDDTDIGFNLQVLFEGSNLSVLAGGATALATNSITASIVSGSLKNSQATLNALKEWGNASIVTSGSGIVMSNQPLPVLAVSKNGYLASMTSEITDYGKSTEITPGEITTGFAMTVIPHILERRELILQYNINLSNLDEMKVFNTSDVSIELPQTSNRSFAQTMRMKMGQTLVLAGYQQDIQKDSNALGFLMGGKNKSNSKSLLIITIQVENADI